MGRATRRSYTALAPLVGALVTLMLGVNSRFSWLVGNLVATLVIHVVGLVGVSAVLLVKREEAQPGRLPFYYYLGGFVGVGTVFSSNYVFGALGASLAVALALLGQTLFSIAADATGLMGRRKYPLAARSLPGIALAIAGVAVIGAAAMGQTVAVGAWRTRVPAMLLALGAGALPGLSFVLNSELGRMKGVMRSTRVNYLVGLATTLLVVAAVRPPAAEALRAVAAAGPLLALGGGLMGVIVVAAMNVIFPRTTAFAATLLLFSGQALTGVFFEVAVEGAFDARKLVGTVLLLAGLAIHALLTRRGTAGGAGGAGSQLEGGEMADRCGEGRPPSRD
jgi:transporter family-2 protein